MDTISAQDIVDTVSEGLVVLGRDLTVASANRRFYELFAVAPEETIGRRITALGDGQWDIPELRRLLEEILPQRRVVDAFEVDHVFPGVGRRIVHLNARKVFRQGNQVEHVLVTFYDVTAVREEQLRAARAAMVARTIVDTIRDPLVILDKDLKITMASRNFVRMFGDAEADVVGKEIFDLKQGQWNVAALRAQLERVVPDEAPVEEFLIEDEFPDIGHRAFKLNARKIHVDGNHVTQLLLAFEDVTEAIAVDRHKDVLAAELAHRIKNSLQVISAFVAFEIRRAAEPCRDGYLAMQSRINAVAELYDVVAQSSAFGPVNVETYFEGIAASIRSSLLGEASQIEIVVDAEPLALVADHAVPIGLLVNELATNAVKYAFPEGSGSIVLGFRQRNGEVVLSVEDNGVGFDHGAASAPPASGMGTRFIDAFVRQISGTLARASGDTGTTVIVHLPTSVLTTPDGVS
ncbi:sensor histidine kinase [Consotaella salsifontis]|uniref:histidine kinase n=1 Tax=Consotaella salsifontis TaxID=1365950 RepID=A0A1T4SEN7_9HYPH|nr:PAS domain-containing protein [Consotaella salsifontis]SKA26653.1 PAS domain S-box-containing protein [Consotaella salsifontis]